MPFGLQTTRLGFGHRNGMDYPVKPGNDEGE
jgi:hypothetical protein